MANSAVSQQPSIGRSRIVEFRAAIAEALAGGAKAASLVLKVTALDEALLKREPSVAVQEISFLNGEMRFLGIRVVAGEVLTSALEKA